MLIAYALVIAIMGPFFVKFFVPAAAFADHQQELQVTESRFVYEPDEPGLGRVSCLGTLQNTGRRTWKNPQIEVQYYDDRGEMIDTFTDIPYSVRVRPGQEIAFRVSGFAARPSTEYRSHKVWIRNADEARDLF